MPAITAASPPRPVTAPGGISTTTSLLCLPTYDEAENIEALIRAVLAESPVDILVVDDGSPDGTGEIVERLAAAEPRVRLLRRSARLGLGTAYLTAFRHGLDLGYARFLTMDADFSHAPSKITALLGGLDGGLDLVIGSRYVAGGRIIGWGWHRRVLSAGANAFARFRLNLKSHDCTSGFRAYRRSVVEYLAGATMEAAGYSSLVEMLVRSERAGFRVGEEPITFVDRVHGTSKMSSREILDGIVNVMSLAAKLPAKAAAVESAPIAKLG